MNLHPQYPLTQALLHFWQALDFKLYNIEPMDRNQILNLSKLMDTLCHHTALRVTFGIPSYHE